MRRNNAGTSISGLAALVLLGVFAIGILSVLLSGAEVYRRLTQRDRLAYDSRTCIQYVAMKVRQAPAPGAVVLSEFGGEDCLEIAQPIDGTEYRTRIYCHEGWLMELFALAEEGFAPEDGEKILRVDRFSLTKEGTLLEVDVVEGNGTASSMWLSLRGGEGAEP